MVKAASVAWRPLTHDAERWFVSLMETLTAFVSYTTMALVEEGRLLGTRQLDMGNSGQEPYPESTEGGHRVSVLKWQEGAPVLLG